MVLPVAMMSIFFTMFCCFAQRRRRLLLARLKLPADASPVSASESRQLMEQLLGEWRIIPLGSAPGALFGGSNAYEKAYFEHGVVHLSGGFHSVGRRRHRRLAGLPTQSQPISFSRTADGTLYVDTQGTKVTTWAPERGEVLFETGLGHRMAYRRELSGGMQMAACTAGVGMGMGTGAMQMAHTGPMQMATPIVSSVAYPGGGASGMQPIMGTPIVVNATPVDERQTACMLPPGYNQACSSSL